MKERESERDRDGERENAEFDHQWFPVSDDDVMFFSGRHFFKYYFTLKKKR